MEQKTLGLDLGTSSIGIALRDRELDKNIAGQLVYYSSVVFKSGVGKDSSGEYSFAAKRTEKRSTRRLYQSRKYRIWATLELLISHRCCPLSEAELERWSKYDKQKGFHRSYPSDALEFEQWVRLDFNGDGIADYSSPYQLREELITRELDWEDPTDRYKFGRAMYHIAQRRGFKSSKGDTLKDMGKDDDLSSVEIGDAMKKSEEKKSKGIVEYMVSHGLQTVGQAYAHMERSGIRVRNHSEYQAVQSQLYDEVEAICHYQHIDVLDSELHTRLISRKQGEGTIFYRRPLRSQKSSIGYCTLEPDKRRCPVSHPDYEEFRALSFINNIKYRTDPDGEWTVLSTQERQELFTSLFARAKVTFKFEDIRQWLEKRNNGLHFDYHAETINYRDYVTVAGCPVISRLKKILGEDWRTAVIQTDRDRYDRKTGSVHKVGYNYEDLWHLCFCSDDFEELMEFAKSRMNLGDRQATELARLWGNLKEGYTTLSIKAIRNILPFLREGLIYSTAVAVAKIPEIVGQSKWNQHKATVLMSLDSLSDKVSRDRLVSGIANTLISNYKSLPLDEQFAYKDYSYRLSVADKNAVADCIKKSLGERKLKELPDEEELIDEVTELYQKFFFSPAREYYKLPRQSESLVDFLHKQFPEIDEKEWNRLYHHSQIAMFPQAPSVDLGTPQLGTPDIGSIKNPVVLKALHTLKRTLNAMLAQHMIDEDTRIVVETARDMNDANWRRAIDRYQKEREKENEAITSIIREFRPNYTDADIEKGRLLFEQNIPPQTNREEKAKAERFALDLQKYKFWREQNFQCIYTGIHIGLSDLFDDSKVDIEHTIPRSISFDNSLRNRTVCISHFNRYEKGNRIPSELSNYSDILTRIKPWMDKVEHLKSQVELWRGNARIAPTVDRKNECLQQMHQWELELDYWKAKVETFRVQKDDLNSGFKNSQLVDTRIITKYAFHYLKSVFKHVDVQKGETTAVFRKILGVQSADEKKDRNRHSHHAIDAAVLTMIPYAAQRDRMIELFYGIQEAQKIQVLPQGGSDIQRMQQDLCREIASCNLGTVNGLVETIESNILINHLSKDQTLAPAHRRRRINGTIVRGQWLQGDSIRASLHKDSFYGAIQSPTKEKLLVKRAPLAKMAAKDIDTIVDERLKEMIKSQLQRKMDEDGLSFAKAIEGSFYMLDHDGNPITHDCNQRPIAPIRHVRCYAKAGRGFLKIDTALQIKRQTYQSKHPYKNSYYAQNDDNYLCLLYEGLSKGKPQRKLRLVNYFEIAQLHLKNVNVLYHEPEFAFYQGERSMPLKAIIKKGTRVLMYEKHKDEVRDMDNARLSNRLFVVYKFNSMGTPSVYLRNHLEARNETACSPEEKATAYTPTNRISFLTLKADNFKALIEHMDFRVDHLGEIHFI